MKHFIANLIRFFIPVLVIFVVPVTVLVLGREYVSVDTVVAKQRANPETLFGFMYNGQSFVPYKEQLVRKAKPSVVVLGTSRVMQIRQEFFKEGTMFINAGGGAKNIHDVKQFMDALPADASVVILGLDQDMFTSKETKPSYDTSKDATLLRLRTLLFTNMRKIYIDSALGKYSYAELFEKRKNGSFGIVAITRGDGFRSDGSYRYGHILVEKNKDERVAQEVTETARSLSFGRYASFATTGNEEANMLVLREILKQAKERGIYVVGFLPPYPSLLYGSMKNDPNYATTINVLPQSIQKAFKESGFLVFDFSDIRTYGGNDAEFVDNIHASDVASAKMLLKMSGSVPFLRTYVDVSKIRAMLDAKQGTMFTF